MLNSIHGRKLSKQHTAKVKIFPETATKIIFEKIESHQESKPDMLVVHTGASGLWKNKPFKQFTKNTLEIFGVMT